MLSWAGLGLVCDDMHMLVCMLFVCMCGMLLVYRVRTGCRYCQRFGLCGLCSTYAFVCMYCVFVCDYVQAFLAV